MGDIFQQLHDMMGGFHIQVACRLVRYDYFRLVEQGAGDSDALLLAARKLVGHLVQLLHEPYFAQHFLYALGDFLFVFPARSP